EEREHTVHGDIGEQRAPAPWQMLEVGREDCAVDDVAKVHDESRRDHHPQGCFCDEERKHGELGRAREHEHAHRDGLRLRQARAHHRDACYDPPGDDADEERGRGESAGPSIFYVNASAGSDMNPGTQTSKFKTITKAMSVATRSGTTVQVDPGLYDVANGEIFPITLPAGVLLKGAETTWGGGSTPTSIVGGGLAPGATAGSVGV